MVGDINKGEKLDRFVDGLKYIVKMEIMKTNCNSFEECARMALNIDSAIWRARRPTGFFSPDNSGTTTMEIGNVTGSRVTNAQCEQRRKDLNNGACFKCHKIGCRPWKCASPRVNHVEVNSVTEEANVILSDSENG